MNWRARVEAQLGALTLNVDLHGEAGPVALVGPNGSGKTTLLRMIAGAHTPERGRIEVEGTPLFDSERALSLPPQARRIGYVPQGYGLFPHLRAVDNVAFGLSIGPNKRPRKSRRRAALEMLEELDCGPLADRFPAELSGGEQQRVALARALVLEPKLLLLDEPLAALDATARRAVRQFLAARLVARPCLVVTHDVRDVLALNATVCVLQDGRIVQRGDVPTLRTRPATDFVAELVGITGGRAERTRCRAPAAPPA